MAFELPKTSALEPNKGSVGLVSVCNVIFVFSKTGCLLANPFYGMFLYICTKMWAAISIQTLQS